MSKSYLDILLQLYDALFKDITAAFPQLGLDAQRDLARLTKFVRDRGIGVFLTDMPKAGKHFDACLDRGQYSHSGLPITGSRSKRLAIPQFLRGLYLLVFHENGLLKKEVDYGAICFIRQVYYLAKKVKLPCPDEAIAQEIEQFLFTDSLLPEPSGFWEGGQQSAQSLLCALSFSEALRATEKGRELIKAVPSIGRRLDLVFARISSALGPYRPENWNCKHGPGAISAVSGPVNKYHWYSWPDRLDYAFPISDHGFYSWSSWVRQSGSSFDFEEEPSRLIAVPKTFDKPRLIAAEPNSHMFCQQNMLDYMRTRIRNSWLGEFLHMQDQTFNQELCRKGSVDGSLATFDLSEASDRVTCNVVEAAFRGNLGLLSSLIACRTRFVRVEYGNSVFEHRLNKFSTMGSAVTFPVESLIFLGIAIAACCDGSPKAIGQLMGSVAVFGDDIIIPRTAGDLMVDILEALCFKVNVSKSFTGDNFRESCGVDACHGVDVTPVYLRSCEPSDAKALVGMVATTNHFYKKWMLNVADILRRTVRDVINVPDIHPSSQVFGFHTRVVPSEVPRYRWGKNLQRVEVRSWVVSTTQDRTKPEDDSRIFQFLLEDPAPSTRWDAGFTERARVKLTPCWADISDLYGPFISSRELLG